MDFDEGLRLLEFYREENSIHRDQLHENLRSHQAELNNALDGFVTGCTALVTRLEALEEKRKARPDPVHQGSVQPVVVTKEALADLERFITRRERWSPFAWWRRLIGDPWRSFFDG